MSNRFVVHDHQSNKSTLILIRRQKTHVPENSELNASNVFGVVHKFLLDCGFDTTANMLVKECGMSARALQKSVECVTNSEDRSLVHILSDYARSHSIEYPVITESDSDVSNSSSDSSDSSSDSSESDSSSSSSESSSESSSSDSDSSSSSSSGNSSSEESSSDSESSDSSSSSSESSSSDSDSTSNPRKRKRDEAVQPTVSVAKKRRMKVPFRRVRREDVDTQNESFGNLGSLNTTPHNQLLQTKGKLFRKAKTRRKRGATIGSIDPHIVNSFKFKKM